MKELYFEKIDSTNTYLKEHYGELEDMCFVRADYQYAGKGRNDRKWTAQEKVNLTFSLLIKDEKVISSYKALSVLSAYSVLQVLNRYGIKEAKIKWPNDVCVKDKKICGILLESVSKEKIECLIIGIGLNVNQTLFAGTYLREPTSLKKELNEDIDLLKLKDDIYSQLSDNILSLKQGHDFYEEISSYDYLKDKTAKADLDGQRRTVKIIGIDKDYSLRCECEGMIRNIESGEISFHQGDC
ncbi:MAG: biotin--[acetyl-CoA-carboxylase] ligase [Erysipelotrichaceae bacterium]|nr:biotin--[acetyl-CoA-carboxylase] ligase [Erysipelotrichaceae bacterium]